mmetsp:Transcript_10547/g.18764  ORF Transcript_10547/g.18764 Transcript_10547/m.18764 type:complete len:83 (-) Transcript_10547:61-309(-)
MGILPGLSFSCRGDEDGGGGGVVGLNGGDEGASNIVLCFTGVVVASDDPANSVSLSSADGSSGSAGVASSSMSSAGRVKVGS